LNFQALLEKRDARIRELEVENMELKSKLDKYQSIFSSVDGGPVSPGNKLECFAIGIKTFFPRFLVLSLYYL
jgi:hypothetical protein